MVSFEGCLERRAVHKAVELEEKASKKKVMSSTNDAGDGEPVKEIKEMVAHVTEGLKMMEKLNKALLEGLNEITYENKSKEDDNMAPTLEAKVAFLKEKVAF